MRTIGKMLLSALGAVVIVWVIDTALSFWAWRTRNPRALDFIKRFHKNVTNPVMLRFAGRSGHSAIVHHVGRRSGEAYATPVVAHRAPQDVIIPLPYGPDVDWLRNLQAAGKAVVDLEGRSHSVGEAAVVDIGEVIGLLPDPMVRTVRFNAAREAVRLPLSEDADLAPA